MIKLRNFAKESEEHKAKIADLEAKIGDAAGAKDTRRLIDELIATRDQIEIASDEIDLEISEAIFNQGANRREELKRLRSTVREMLDDIGDVLPAAERLCEQRLSAEEKAEMEALAKRLANNAAEQLNILRDAAPLVTELRKMADVYDGAGARITKGNDRLRSNGFHALVVRDGIFQLKTEPTEALGHPFNFLRTGEIKSMLTVIDRLGKTKE